MPAPKAIRVKTSTGWQDVAIIGPPGPGSSMPLGAISPYSGSSDPTDPAYLIADGREISRANYADYFAQVATTYGVGNNTTTFNIPNLKGKVPVGRDTGQAEFDVLGENGGLKTITLTAAESGLRDHGHTVGASAWYPFGGHVFSGYENLMGYKPGWQAVDAWLEDNISNRGGSVGNSGAANAVNGHNNLQPYIVLNYIVRVLPGVPNYGTGIPIGSPISWLVAAIPSGFREFDGSAIVQAIHPQLYALFGTTIPDLRGRVLMGASGTYGIGTTGGEAAHALTAGETALRAHTHNDPGTQFARTAAIAQVGAGGSFAAVNDWASQTGGITGGEANGAAHNNLQPYRTVKWITVAG